MVIGLPLKKDQIEEELTEIREKIKELSNRGGRVPDESSSPGVSAYIKYLVEERERTNKLLVSLTEKVSQLEHKINNEYEVIDNQASTPAGSQLEVHLSDVDVTIFDFIQISEKQMVCAEQVQKLMNYKGRNAACARLNAMCKIGLLRKDQMGHKVYYRFDAGKATKALIISPPQ